MNAGFLTEKEFDQHGKVSTSLLRRRFGGWKNVLAAAGLEHKYSGRSVSVKMRQNNKALSDKQVLEELRNIAAALGKGYLTQQELNNHSERISASTVIYRFGSWPNGLEKAGLSPSPGSRRYSEDEYFENLLNVWTTHGRQPSLREMDEPPSIISSGAYEARFKGWRKGLEAFVAKMNQDVDESVQARTVEAHVPQPKAAPKRVAAEDRTKLSLAYDSKFSSATDSSAPSVGPVPLLTPLAGYKLTTLFHFRSAIGQRWTTYRHFARNAIWERAIGTPNSSFCGGCPAYQGYIAKDYQSCGPFYDAGKDGQMAARYLAEASITPWFLFHLARLLRSRIRSQRRRDWIPVFRGALRLVLDSSQSLGMGLIARNV